MRENRELANLTNYLVLSYEAARGRFKQLEQDLNQVLLEFSSESIGVVKRRVMVRVGEKWEHWSTVDQDVLILRAREIGQFRDALVGHLRKLLMDRILTINSRKDELEGRLPKLQEKFGDYQFAVEPHETRFKTVVKLQPGQKVSEPDFQQMSSIAAGN